MKDPTSLGKARCRGLRAFFVFMVGWIRDCGLGCKKKGARLETSPTGGGGLRCGMGCRILRGAAGGARGPPSAHENRRLQIYSKT